MKTLFTAEAIPIVGRPGIDLRRRWISETSAEVLTGLVN
jgi:hypothetical protein